MNSYEEFRNVIRQEREDLTRLSDFWNSQVKCDKTISKEVQGRIRAAVGKTRLLLSEKFKQFEGLVDQSENNTSEKEISINDLQGFWDLVLIQINEIKEMFRSLDLPKNRDPDSRKDSTRGESNPGNVSKRKSSSDQLEQTERKIKEITEREKGRTEGVDLKNKLSLSKL